MGTATVRATVLNGWFDRLEGTGADAADALSFAGIIHQDSYQASNAICLHKFTRLAEFVGQRAGPIAASWNIGERYPLTELGDVGAAIVSARTLGAALTRLADNFELLQDASDLSMRTDADTATVAYRILDPSIWPRHHDAMFSLGIIAKVIKMAVPDAMHAVDLGFECTRRDTGLRMAQEQMMFECETNSIQLPVAMLDAPMPPADLTCDMTALAARRADLRRSRSARERLASIIFARLSDGDTNQDDLACEIGMSSRTMRRRLADEQTSFQQLLDDCRMRQAVLEFQARPSASIADIALRLGYAEHSTFTRAFSRWAGTPPQRFRSEMAATMH